MAPLELAKEACGFQARLPKRHVNAWAHRLRRWLQGRLSVGQKLAGGLGFEPRKTESESAVIPFHHPPTMPLKLRHNWSRIHRKPSNRLGKSPRRAAPI